MKKCVITIAILLALSSGKTTAQERKKYELTSTIIESVTVHQIPSADAAALPAAPISKALLDYLERTRAQRTEDSMEKLRRETRSLPIANLISEALRINKDYIDADAFNAAGHIENELKQIEGIYKQLQEANPLSIMDRFHKSTALRSAVTTRLILQTALGLLQLAQTTDDIVILANTIMHLSKQPHSEKPLNFKSSY